MSRDSLSAERKRLQEEGLLPEWFTTDGYSLFKQKYAVEGEQSFFGRAKTIAKTAASYMPEADQKEWEDKFFNLIWKGWLSCSTPVLSNTGTDRGMSVSCSGQYVGDSVDQFYSNLHESAVLSKNGFGTSAYLGDIRPRGSDISVGGKSSGILPVLQDFVTMSNKVSQGSQRRGAFAGYIDIDHADFDEIADYAKNHPDDLNIGWVWKDSDTAKAQAGDVETTRRFKKALKLKMLTGKGYFFFKDKVNRLNPASYVNNNLEVKSSNLCVAPETEVLTDKGYRKISDMENQLVNVWNGKEFSETTIRKTGVNQKLITVCTDSGMDLTCTPYHKFYVKDTKKGKVIEKQAIELCEGDKLIKCDFPVIEGTNVLEYAHASAVWMIRPCFFVPDSSYTIESRMQWLSGLFDVAGYVTTNNKKQSLELHMTDLEFLQKLQKMLHTCGVSSKVTCQADNGCLMLFWRIIISQTGINTLQSLGFKTHRLALSNHIQNRNYVQYVKVTDVIDEGRYDDTYCFNEPKRNKGVFNGLLTGQCIEINLFQDEQHTYSCVLSSMNIARYNEWKDTSAVFDATVFLDCIAEDFIRKADGIPAFEKIVRFTKKGRALGLGACGFHTYLQDNMIAFESLEAQFFNSKLFKDIKEAAVQASKYLASIFGEPEWCKGLGVRNTHLLAIAPTMSTSLIQQGISQGIEPVIGNVFIQSGAGGEIERVTPSFLKLMKARGKYSRKLMKHIADNYGSVQDQDWLTDEEKLVFRTAFEINQSVILRLAAQRQKYVCQGQSLNLFFSADEKEEVIAAIHKEAILDENIKGLYYVRTQSGVKSNNTECLACQ